MRPVKAAVWGPGSSATQGPTAGTRNPEDDPSRGGGRGGTLIRTVSLLLTNHPVQQRPWGSGDPCQCLRRGAGGWTESRQQGSMQGTRWLKA